MYARGLENERELMMQISEGDEYAFTKLFNVYQPLLSAYVFSITKSGEITEEIVQDVFLKIWVSRETLGEVNSFKSYLFIISRNLTLNFIKKLANEHKKASSLKLHISQTAEITDSPDLYGTIIDQAISQLPPQQQKVYLLSRHEGVKYADIAARMGISPRTVKSYIKLATESITRFIKEQNGLLIPALVSTSLPFHIFLKNIFEELRPF